MVNHALALLAFDQGALEEAARYADVALAATTDSIITSFHRKLNYRRRRIAEAQLLREALHASGRLLPSDGVRLALEAAQTILVLRCSDIFPLVEDDFNGWRGGLHFLQGKLETLPDVALSTWPEQGGMLVIDGVPEVLPPLLDSQPRAQVLIMQCPALLASFIPTIPLRDRSASLGLFCGQRCHPLHSRLCARRPKTLSGSGCAVGAKSMACIRLMQC
ncbi:MAG: hypothetical protein NTV37_07800 [Proteobacteria bacterium]|nr:hypothetical protein [Pseudomonadota bacterium]